MIQIRVFYSDNFVHDNHSYVAPKKATVVDLERYIQQFNNYGYSAWAEIEVVS
jgi:hypothetical protein